MIEFQRLTLRNITDGDLPFLRELYNSTRTTEMEMVDWSAQEKQDFLAMQFNAQHQYYMEHYANAAFKIIEDDATPIGRLYLDRTRYEIRIVDIALSPHYRGKGIGSFFLNNIMVEAERKKVAVRIHVENFNPAMRLYKRLEFRHIDTNGVYHLMEWTPH